MKNKDFVTDQSGKSLAFFSKKKFTFSNELLLELKGFYKKNKKEVRICMHKSKSSNLQVMINLIILKDNYQVHYHKFSDEYYLPLCGKLRLVTYDYKNKIKSYEDLDGKKKILGKILKGERHIAVPLNPYCIYLEFRSGNFSKHKNIFIRKFERSKKIISLK